MANELQSLSTLYQNRLFRIPDYQRGFAWKKDQLTDFWEDLINLHPNRFHYTGLLSLKEVKGIDYSKFPNEDWLLRSGYKQFHIVDGQQRLTTFSILIYEIIKLVKNLEENIDLEDDKIFLGFDSLKDIMAKYVLRMRPPENIVKTYLFGYENDNPSYDYLRYAIFEEPGSGALVETYYTRNLKQAKTFFEKNLQDLYETDGIEGIELIYKKLTLQLMFNLHEIEDDYDVFVAFETMNNRGKKLTNLELLKNRLIYLTTLYPDEEFDKTNKDQLRKNINDAWKEVYYQLGRNPQAPLSDDEFLRAHWITYYQYTRTRGGAYIHFLLNKFSAKKVFEKHILFQDLEEEIQLSDFELENEDENGIIPMDPEPLVSSKLAPTEIADYVNDLKTLAKYWYKSFFPEQCEISEGEKLWLGRLNRIGIGYFRPLVVAALATEKFTTPESRIELFKAIERFIFVTFRLAGWNASYHSSIYYNKSRELLEKTITIESITESLTETTNRDMAAAIKSFITRNNRRFDSGLGFYGWRDLRYLLFEYEYDLGIKSNIHKIDWRMFTQTERDKVTIEHILPQTPTDQYWQNLFGKYSPDEIKSLSNSLGNLLPLSQSINSSLQNDPFPEKKTPSKENPRGYTNGSNSEIEVSKNDDWTAYHIYNRGIKIMNFMARRWKLNLSNEDIEELLHISFIHKDC